MSVVKPRTVVVTQLPVYTHTLNVNNSSGSDYEVYVDDGSDGDSTDGGPRKRRRLTNLTAEEKLMRRKLKNRVAAQTARDRKKQRMTELEEMLAVIQAENQQLIQQNENLRQVTTVLSKENKTLKERLETTNSCPAPVVAQNLSKAQPESAAGGASNTVSANNTASGGILCHDDQPHISTGLVCQHNKVVSVTIQQRSQKQFSNITSDIEPIETEQEIDVEVVGPTPEVLDSFNELIRFDHMYYKTPPTNIVGQKPTVCDITTVKDQAKSPAVPVSTSNKDITEIWKPDELFDANDHQLFSDVNCQPVEDLLSESDVLELSEVLEQLLDGETSSLINSVHEISNVPDSVFNPTDETFIDTMLEFDGSPPEVDELETFSNDEKLDANSTQDTKMPLGEELNETTEFEYYCPSTSPYSTCTPSPNSSFESIENNPAGLLTHDREPFSDSAMETNYNLSPRLYSPSPVSCSCFNSDSCNFSLSCEHSELFNDQFGCPWIESYMDLFPSLSTLA